MYQGNRRLSVYMTKLQDMQHVPKRFETGRQYTWKSYNTQQVPTRPETGHQHTWQSYNTKHVYLQDPRQVAVHVTKLQHTACTYALGTQEKAEYGIAEYGITE